MEPASDNPLETALTRFLDARRNGRPVSPQSLFAGGRQPASDEFLRRVRTAIRLGKSDSAAYPTRMGIDGLSDDPTQWPDVPGYDLVDVVGQGGMGIVYEGFQRGTGRRVAVKLIRSVCGVRSEALIRRMEREVELAARLSHPAIVSVLGAGQSDQGPFLVMDFVEGKPLNHQFAPGCAGVGEVLTCMAEIADGIDYAHQRGVAHRDLKPSNIVVTPDGRPRVLDFGLAKAVEPDSGLAGASAGMRGATLSEPGAMMGTLGYMAPEQAEGRDVSIRADIYSLGAVAYELVTGALPCSTLGPLGEVLARISRTEPSPPSRLRPGVSRDLDAVLLKALEKDPGARYATAGSLAEDLRRAADGRTVAARPVGTLGRARRWARRNKPIAGAIAAAATVVILAAVGNFIVIRRQRDAAIELLLRVAPALESVAFPTNDRLKQTLGAETVRAELMRNVENAYELIGRDAARAGIGDKLAPGLRRVGDALADSDRERARLFYQRSLDANPDETSLSACLANARLALLDAKSPSDLVLAISKLASHAEPTDARAADDLDSTRLDVAARAAHSGNRGDIQRLIDPVLARGRRASRSDEVPQVVAHTRALLRCGGIMRRCGALDAEDALLLEADELTAKLVSRPNPDTRVWGPRLSAIMARAKVMLEDAASMHPQSPEAVKLTEHARKLLDPGKRIATLMLDAEPMNSQAKVAAAWFFRQLGSLGLNAAPDDLEARTQCVADYEKSLSISRELYAAAPGIPQYQTGFIVALQNLGNACLRMGTTERTAYWARGSEVYKELLSLTDPSTGALAADPYERPFATIMLARIARKLGAPSAEVAAWVDAAEVELEAMRKSIPAEQADGLANYIQQTRTLLNDDADAMTSPR